MSDTGAPVPRQNDADVPLFVPVALREDQAVAALAAVRTVFMSGLGAGGDPEIRAPLAQSMVVLAEAIDKARAKAGAA